MILNRNVNPRIVNNIDHDVYNSKIINQTVMYSGFRGFLESAASGQCITFKWVLLGCIISVTRLLVVWLAVGQPIILFNYYYYFNILMFFSSIRVVIIISYKTLNR